MAKPDFVAMAPREYKVGEETKTYWTEVGSAWRTKNGDGINITLTAFPVGGSFSLFPPKEKPKSESET